LAFDYEFMPRRFGNHLNQAEVDRLIEVINSKLQSSRFSAGQEAITKSSTL
jgi:hypothetical protein